MVEKEIIHIIDRRKKKLTNVKIDGKIDMLKRMEEKV